MHAFEGIPPAALRKAPRIWVNTEGGFGRRIIDPRWVSDFHVKSEAARERALLRAEAASDRKARAAALAAISKREREKFQAELRALGREAIEEAKRDRWEAIAARWAAVGPLPTANAIIEAVAAAHGFPVDALLGKSRSVPIVVARQQAAYEIRRQRRMSLPEIGRRLGGRDHTTILSAVRVWPKKAEALGIPCKPIEDAR